MNRVILIFILSFIGHTLLAQSPTELLIQRSDRFVENDKADDLKVLCKMDNGNLFTVRFGKKHCIVNLLNSKLELQFNKTIEKEKGEIYKGHIRMGNKMKIFTVDASNKRERIINCYIFDLLQGSHQKQQLVRLPIEKGKELFQTEKKLQTGFSISENHKYVAIAMGSAKRKKRTYFTYVFDSENLETVSKNRFQENDTNGFDPKGMYVDNEATIFLLKKVWIETDEYAFDEEDEIENYEYQLHKLNQGNKTSVKIQTEGKFIKSLRMRSINNTLQLLGYYADKGYDRIEGTCTFTINKDDLTVQSSKTNLFPKQLFSDVFGKNDRSWLLGFSIDYLIEDKKGNAYLLAKSTTDTDISSGSSFLNNQHIITTETALKINIIILKINASGELVWGRGLHKISKHGDYNAFIKNEKIHILMNSGEKTLEKMKKRAIFKDESLFSALYDIVYASDGSVSYHKIQNNEEHDLYIPIHGLYTKGIFLITSEDKYDRKYMKLN
ncbi:hypothetical protein [uncultured Kordia sp.]|uniref:hypothetical protein n=1 Tax=uncultured Kordia sp. TaxID=507699 RepID=UPI002626F4A5|nr:hypothetical protein [uncultured Kordia sp.]